VVERPQARRLQFAIPSSVKAYNRILIKRFKACNFYAKVCAVYSQVTFPISPKLQKRAEMLDALRIDCMRAAEKGCRIFRMGEVEYSPEVSTWGKRIYIWRTVLKWHDNSKCTKLGRRNFRKKAKACGIFEPFSITRSQVCRNLIACESEYQRVKDNAPKLRVQHLRRRQQAADDRGDYIAAKGIQLLIAREACVKQWRRIQHVLKPRDNIALTVVDVVRNGTTSTFTSREDVEREIMMNNTSRFRLASSYVLNTGDLASALGRFAVSALGVAILGGHYLLPGQYPTLLHGIFRTLSRIARKVGRSRNSECFSYDNFQQYWKGSKERTSSAYSGLHFGHYKAAAHDNFLSEIHAMMTEICMRGGFAFPRWKRGLSVMIPKKPGAREVTQQRALLLFEGDFNWANKAVFADRMISRAEACGAIPDEQYARKGHTALEVAQMRMFHCDLLRLRRWPGAIASVDANNCFDRIGHSFMSLSCQAMGVGVGPLVSMLSALSYMAFYIRTGYGDSRSHYGGTNAMPFEGLGQGNGAGPAGWLAVSSVLLDYLHKACKCTSGVSALSCRPFSYVAMAFVDDTDIPVMATSASETPRSVFSRLQTAVSHWGQTLKYSGGLLVNKKSHWWPIFFVWDGNKWRYGRKPRGVQITVPNEGGNEEKIELCKPDEGKKLMGVIAAADGNMTGQLKRFQDKLDVWLTRIDDGHLPRKAVWTAFFGTIWRTIAYALPATTITIKQFGKLMRPVFLRLLSRLGVNRNMHRTWVFAHKDFQGLGMPNCYLEQTIAQINFLEYQLDSNSTVSDVMTACYEQVMLEIGTSKGLFEKNWALESCLATECWLVSAWEGVSKFGKIMRPVFLRLLSRLGVNRNMHRSWVFAHKDFQGLGMPHCYLEQTIAQINFLEYQLETNSKISDVMTACYEQVMLEIGTSKGLFEKNWTLENYLATKCWLVSAWE
jgi:hypothetical protein